MLSKELKLYRPYSSKAKWFEHKLSQCKDPKSTLLLEIQWSKEKRKILKRKKKILEDNIIYLYFQHKRYKMPLNKKLISTLKSFNLISQFEKLLKESNDLIEHYQKETFKLKVRSLIQGMALGGDYKQAIVMLETLSENIQFDFKVFSKKLIQHLPELKASDFMTLIIKHPLFEEDPLKASETISSSNIKPGYEPSKEPLTRAMISGCFKDWHNLTVKSIITTHTDSKTIIAGILIASMVNDAIAERPLNPKDAIVLSIQMLANSNILRKEEIQELKEFNFGTISNQLTINHAFNSVVACVQAISIYLDSKNFTKAIEHLKQLNASSTVISIVTGILFTQFIPEENQLKPVEHLKKEINLACDKLFTTIGV